MRRDRYSHERGVLDRGVLPIWASPTWVVRLPCAARNARTALFEARARGDLREHVDLPLAVDALGSLVFYRLLVGEDPMDADEIETVVLALMRGIATDPEQLVREYAGHEEHDPAEHHPATA